MRHCAHPDALVDNRVTKWSGHDQPQVGFAIIPKITRSPENVNVSMSDG